MSVHLVLTCGGCPATTTTHYLRKRFVSFTGKPYGLGTYRLDDPEALTPDGWMMYDPHTQATYCPDCWAGLLAAFAADDAERGAS